MNPLAQKLLADALKLPECERANLAAELLDSLDPSSDAEIEAQWQAEIAQRLKSLGNGTAVTLTRDEARELMLGEGHDPATT